MNGLQITSDCSKIILVSEGIAYEGRLDNKIMSNESTAEYIKKHTGDFKVLTLGGESYIKCEDMSFNAKKMKDLKAAEVKLDILSLSLEELAERVDLIDQKRAIVTIPYFQWDDFASFRQLPVYQYIDAFENRRKYFTDDNLDTFVTRVNDRPVHCGVVIEGKFVMGFNNILHLLYGNFINAGVDDKEVNLASVDTAYY